MIRRALLALLLLCSVARADIVFDAALESSQFTTTSPFDIAFIPTGTPTGVIVFIIQAVSNIDVIQSVTYGTRALNRVSRAADGATELGAVYAYFIGNPEPGPQTVSITHTGAADPKIATVISVIGTLAPATVGVRGFQLQNNRADPSGVIDPFGEPGLAFAVLYYGGVEAAATVPCAICGAMTSVSSHPFAGAYSGHVARQTTSSTSAFTIGWTAATDDVAIVGFGVSELNPIRRRSIQY